MDQPDAPTPTEPTPTDAPAPEEAPTTPEAADPAGAHDRADPTDEGGGEAVSDEAPPVEATVPVEEPADGVPTPVAAPAEGPAASAAHDASARPKPVMAKVTPVLAAVAVAWVLKKLLTRNRA